MATWIAHLRIAEKLLEALPELDERSFTFGSLAPDSGKPNADWSAFDPPKTVTHFQRQGEKGFEDLKFYRSYLRPEDSQGPEDYSFRLGYFFHLLCDNLWFKWIATTTFEEHAALFRQDPSQAEELVKGDWYGLDHLYLRGCPDGLFSRVVVPSETPPTRLPFLSEEGFQYEVDYIRDYYGHPDPTRELDRPFPYLNRATMERFIAESSARVLQIHKRREELDAFPDATSALVLLREQELMPYAAPLGDRADHLTHGPAGRF